jgi:hypothetical protein
MNLAGMEEKTIRKQLDEIKNDLAGNEAEHEVLVNLIRGFEGWLRLHSTKPVETSLPAPPKHKNPISFAKGVIKILQDAHGEALRSDEIWKRMQVLGIRSNAKNPVDWVDWSAQNGGAKRGELPRTWVWKNSNGT